MLDQHREEVSLSMATRVFGLDLKKKQREAEICASELGLEKD